jgi:hypothetical protein
VLDQLNFECPVQQERWLGVFMGELAAEVFEAVSAL